MREASCDSAGAQVAEAEARIQASRADTDRTVLRAPFAGIVAEVNGEVGEYLTPSPPGIPTLPAVDLIDDSCLYVRPHRRGGRGPGRHDRPHQPRHHRASISPVMRRIARSCALEKQARTVEVEVEFDDPGAARHLLIGYSADIEVVIESRADVLRIPTPSLMPGNRVLVLTADDKLAERKIEPGLANWEFTEVKAGVQRGDRVVTSLDREGVKAGARAVAEAKPAPTATKQ
jgi:HlyD family secretion protein